MNLLDVLIIGAGPGGLSTGLGLARQLHTAVIFDSGIYRNALASHMHNVATWDHEDPAAFRAAARKNILARYNTIQFQDAVVQSVTRLPEGLFKATDATGKAWIGRKLVLATGVKDIFPDIDGYRDCWAHGIFDCLFCHGFEERGCASVGVLAIGDIAAVGPAMKMARMANRMTSQVTIYTDGAEELTNQLEPAVTAAGFSLDSRPIKQLIKEPKAAEVTIQFTDGTTKIEGFLVHKPRTEVNGPFAQQLALELTDMGDIKVKPPFYETTVPGVFAVGDCGSPGKAVSQALATGIFCAAGLVAQLQAEPVNENWHSEL